MIRIIYMTRKEFVQIFRDPRMFTMIFVAPIFQLFLFGYAATNDVNNITMAVMDRDHTPQSRELQRAIFNSGYFTNAGAADSDADVEGALVHGFADMVLVVPEGFGNDLARNEEAQLQVLLDGAESNSATVGMGYLGKTLASYTGASIQTRLGRVAAQTNGRVRSLPIVTAEPRFRYNPELKSSFFFVPGVLAMILMVITMLLTSMAITREREIGTIEQLVVTPIKPYQLLLGKMLPFAIIGMIDITIILIVAAGHFHIVIKGSLPLLYFSAVLFLFTTLGMGLLISTLANTQQQAIFVTLMILQPAILLSGLMFPIANMPLPVQWFTYMNPLRYFLVIIRGIILKGNDLMTLAPQFYLLFALGAVIFAVAVARFNKTIE